MAEHEKEKGNTENKQELEKKAVNPQIRRRVKKKGGCGCGKKTK